MTLSRKYRVALRMKFGGKCAYCGCELPEAGWHADHVEAVMRELKIARDKNGHTVMVPTGRYYKPENDRIDNLYPSCAKCNIDKSGMRLEDWRHRLFDLAENLRRNSSAFRHAERFGRVSVIDGPIVFWFEQYLKASVVDSVEVAA